MPKTNAPASVEASSHVTTVHDAIALFNNRQSAPQDRANALGVMIEHQASDLLAILPSHVSLERMKQLFVLNCKKTPKLLECDIKSLMQAVYTAASLGLEPDPALGQLYVVPYGKTAQVIPGYKGLLRLVRNSGLIASIKSETIYANDSFHIDLMDASKCYHAPRIDGDRGEPIAFYAVARFKEEGSEPQYELMTKEQVDAVCQRSASAGKSQQIPPHGGQLSGPWVTDYTEMARKTVLRRLIKQLPISTTKETGQALSAALELDNRAHQGAAAYVDHSTGEVIDIWNGEEEVQASQTELDARLAASRESD